MIRELWESFRAKRRFLVAQYKLADRWLREAASLMPADEDESRWELVGGQNPSSDVGKDLFSEEYRRRVQNKAYHFYRTNEHARSVIRNMEKYIIGPKVVFVPLDDNSAVEQWWDEFEIRNRFVLKQKEIVRRTFRDGECFIRIFENLDTGHTDIRFIDPQHIYDPEKKITHGICTEADEFHGGDIEKVLSYCYCPDGKTLAEIPASEIIHIKIFADSNEKRGNSIFEVVGTSIESYQRWLRDRMILNRVRSFFGIHKRVSNATPGQIANIAASSATGATTDRSGRKKQEPLKPGSIITTSDNVQLVPISANLQAADAQNDGRNLLLAITAGSGMAEFMVTGDASNSNFASTMVSESPAVREFEDWQQFFGVFFKELYSRVIQAGINAGSLPERTVQVQKKSTSDGAMGNNEKSQEMTRATNLEVNLQFPALIHREILDDARAYEIYLRNNLASRRAISTRAGFNFDAELEQILHEQSILKEQASNSPSTADE